MLKCVAAGTALLAASSAALAQVAYELRATAFYQFGAPSDLIAGPAGAPDTSFLRFENLGPSRFTGTFSLSGIDANNNAYITQFVATDFGPGSLGSLSLTNESSNFGGFNKRANLPDLGMLVRFVGTVTDGVNTEAIDLTVYDKDIHSGIFKTNPFGETLDNYILQGGDSLGRDTGDDFEVGQAPGEYVWKQVPAPGATALLSLGMLAAARRRR